MINISDINYFLFTIYLIEVIGFEISIASEQEQELVGFDINIAPEETIDVENIEGIIIYI